MERSGGSFEMVSNKEVVHPWKLTYHLKSDHFSREYIFQPSIFRGHVSFQGCNIHLQAIKKAIWKGSHNPSQGTYSSTMIANYLQVLDQLNAHVDLQK